MSADFWAFYTSGALGICIGNRLDIWKTELQAGNRHFTSPGLFNDTGQSKIRALGRQLRGAAAPVLTYGALNSMLFVTYNGMLRELDSSIFDYNKLAGVDLSKIWVAGAVGGLTCWIISAPTELVRCRTQLTVDGKGSTYATCVDVWKRSGVRGFYIGGTMTSIRDSIGFAWYFWSFELSKRLLLSRQPDPFLDPTTADVLVAGGIAEVVRWTSAYPFDVIKTRIQTESAYSLEFRPLLITEGVPHAKTSWSITKDVYRTEGIRGFFRGLGICNLRAFIVNAIQLYTYEAINKLLQTSA